MRGVARIILVIFALAMMMFVATAALEPLGEEVKERNPDSINGASTIDSLYDAVFKWIPLTMFSGMLVWAIAWYLRRERFVGRGGGGF